LSKKHLAPSFIHSLSSGVSSLIPNNKLDNLAMKSKTVIPTGISLPLELKEQLDFDRGDISLSRYILRIIEKHYGHKFSDYNTKLRAHLLEK
jgi:hypothetical protein